MFNYDTFPPTVDRHERNSFLISVGGAHNSAAIAYRLGHALGTELVYSIATLEPMNVEAALSNVSAGLVSRLQGTNRNLAAELANGVRAGAMPAYSTLCEREDAAAISNVVRETKL